MVEKSIKSYTITNSLVHYLDYIPKLFQFRYMSDMQTPITQYRFMFPELMLKTNK